MVKTLYDKLWDTHVVRDNGDGSALIARLERKGRIGARCTGPH